MTLAQRFLRRAGFLTALCLLIAVPFTTMAASRQRGKRSFRAQKRAPAHSNAAKRRRAEALRQAAVARQRALDAAMRNEVQLMIARDDIKGEDEEVRRVAVNALGNHAGTVVVMDPKTGRIYAIVNQEWALRRGFKPCSTIKLVTGVAGLNERVIDPVDTTKISGAYRINLTDALAYSNNTYFQQVGGLVGFDKMISYARLFGLGQKTGINSANEFAGAVPLFKSGFAVNHMSSHGDNFQVTAVQLATLVSALANGGKLLAPYVPHSSQEEARLTPRVRRQLNIDPEALTRMVPGMVGSVSYGSGRRAYNSQETVAGKTGTCIGDGGWVGLFTSYAPLANPRLAVVVIARGSDAHGHFPAAVAGQIYRDLSSRFGTPTNLQMANRRDWIMQSQRPDPKAALNEEESEVNAADADEPVKGAADNSTSRTNAIKAIPSNSGSTVSNPVNNNVRRVLMPVPLGNQKPILTILKPAPEAGHRPRRVAGDQP
jgi:penicillin-binding protein 2